MTEKENATIGGVLPTSERQEQESSEARRQRIKDLVYVIANRSFVGGPELGFTLHENTGYYLPPEIAKDFVRRGWCKFELSRKDKFIKKEKT